VVVVHGPPVATPFVRDRANRGIRPHPREIEILEQIAGGFSAREIAARLFVSGNA
jgi:DNA-binding NarL/FixJ family response regulator